MPKRLFALSRGGAKDLEVEWRGIWKDMRVRYRGTEIGIIPNGRELRKGQTFTLPDGSMLNVKLAQTLTLVQLQVLRDGQPLPGSDSDPEQQWKLAYWTLLALGVLNIVVGLAAEVLRVDFLQYLGIGVGAIIIGAILFGLGLLAMKRSMIALIVAAGLFALDGLVSFAVMTGRTDAPATTVLVMRLILLFPVVLGIPALWKLNERRIR